MTGDGAGVSRRALLAGLLALPALPLAAACTPSGTSQRGVPDPLIGLADAARVDAARAAAVAAAAPAQAARMAPLRDARLRHAAALDAEVARLDPARASATPAPAPSPAPAGAATMPALRAALAASAKQAGDAALTVAPERVGLVASVSACCATYAELLA